MYLWVLEARQIQEASTSSNVSGESLLSHQSCGNSMLKLSDKKLVGFILVPLIQIRQSDLSSCSAACSVSHQTNHLSWTRNTQVIQHMNKVAWYNYLETKKMKCHLVSLFSSSITEFGNTLSREGKKCKPRMTHSQELSLSIYSSLFWNVFKAYIYRAYGCHSESVNLHVSFIHSFRKTCTNKSSCGNTLMQCVFVRWSSQNRE